MYTVVGCSSCRALWIVADRPDRTACPRCGTSHRFDSLRALHTAEEQSTARRARSALLADRSKRGDGEAAGLAGDDLDLDDIGVPDEKYLEASGLDVDAVEAAVTRNTDRKSSSLRESVIAAVESLDGPTRSRIVERVAESGHDPERIDTAIDGLLEGGRLSVSDGRYRVV